MSTAVNAYSAGEGHRYLCMTGKLRLVSHLGGVCVSRLSEIDKLLLAQSFCTATSVAEKLIWGTMLRSMLVRVGVLLASWADLFEFPAPLLVQMAHLEQFVWKSVPHMCCFECALAHCWVQSSKE